MKSKSRAMIALHSMSLFSWLAQMSFFWFENTTWVEENNKIIPTFRKIMEVQIANICPNLGKACAHITLIFLTLCILESSTPSIYGPDLWVLPGVWTIYKWEVSRTLPNTHDWMRCKFTVVDSPCSPIYLVPHSNHI